MDNLKKIIAILAEYRWEVQSGVILCIGIAIFLLIYFRPTLKPQFNKANAKKYYPAEIHSKAEFSWLYPFIDSWEKSYKSDNTDRRINIKSVLICFKISKPTDSFRSFFNLNKTIKESLGISSFKILIFRKAILTNRFEIIQYLKNHSESDEINHKLPRCKSGDEIYYFINLTSEREINDIFDLLDIRTDS